MASGSGINVDWRIKKKKWPVGINIMNRNPEEVCTLGFTWVPLPTPPTLSEMISSEMRIHVSPFIMKTHVIQYFAETILDDMLVTSIVGSIATPGEFWVMPLQFYNDMEAMMKSMQDVYAKVDASAHLQQCIPQAAELIPGTLFAVKLKDDEWHRCVLVDVNKTETERSKWSYVVRALDFGDMDVVPLDKFRFLFSQFADMKAQAIPCAARMSSFYSPKTPGRTDINMLVKMDRGSGWTKEEGDMFRKIIFDRPVVIRFLSRENPDPETDSWRNMNLRPWAVYIHLPEEGGRDIEIPHVERDVFSTSRRAPYSTSELRQDFLKGQKPATVTFDRDAALDKLGGIASYPFASNINC